MNGLDWKVGLPFLFFLAASSLPAAADNGPVRDIGDRLELFVDDWLIERLAGAELRLNEPALREVAFRFDAPGEGSTCLPSVILKDGDRYRMYYRGEPVKGLENTRYAESADGISWTRVKAGLYEENGSWENNIVFREPDTQELEVFIDGNPAAPAGERYKAFCRWKGKDAEGRAVRGVKILASADGLRWNPLQSDPVISLLRPKAVSILDSDNRAFWDGARNRYAGYLRVFRDGVRSIKFFESKDFRSWSEPEWLDFGPVPAEHLYTNVIGPYFRAPHLLLGFPKRFLPDRKFLDEYRWKGICDTCFISSRDGRKWDRRFMEAFLRPGTDPGNWVYHSRTLAAGGPVETAPGELSFYILEHYGLPDVRLRRATLRTDGFVSVRAGFAGGELLTRPLTFSGRELVLNYATSAAGRVRVEIQDQAGKPLPGFALEDCPEIYGDQLERPVAWKGGGDLSALAGRPVRLRFQLQDADLYSIRFRR
ncbi:MAG: hypothetical protein BWY73_00371 [candidate division TA06 bacterium ADurb.Bin417]|uniref:Glycosyl hydrolase family 32 N-terminal domain-containing protein n=1 Tax=candidate division TA06 bacterium ADurb.Bin417 TaxID=1852828 RepID=A0A1V5MJA7_UNCT6|nr:MAG: hypothetical protein BWY73_00371 [candidate division TA06 bacterium ADurb.Bin417]